MTKLTTILGYDAPKSEIPSLEINGGNDRMAWIEKHLKSTHRRGHWNTASCEAIAAKMGIISDLQIKHHR